MSRIQRTRFEVATNNARKQMAERLPEAVKILLDALDHKHSSDHKHDCYWFQVCSAEKIIKRFLPELQAIHAVIEQVEQPDVALRWIGIGAAKVAEEVTEDAQDADVDQLPPGKP